MAVRIEPFLLEDEALLGSCGTGRGLVCATDVRLLRVEHTPFGRRIRDLSYREISSVTIADRADGTLIATGLLVATLGYLLRARRRCSCRSWTGGGRCASRPRAPSRSR